MAHLFMKNKPLRVRKECKAVAEHEEDDHLRF